MTLERFSPWGAVGDFCLGKSRACFWRPNRQSCIGLVGVVGVLLLVFGSQCLALPSHQTSTATPDLPRSPASEDDSASRQSVTMPAAQKTPSSLDSQASSVSRYESGEKEGLAAEVEGAVENDSLSELERITDVVDGQSLVVQPFSAPIPLNTGSKKRKKLAEISGMTHSPTRPRLLWAIADGNKGRLFALHYDSDRQKVTAIQDLKVKDDAAFDWEAMASFESEGKGFLLIADTGANNEPPAQFLRLLIVEEPTARILSKGKKVAIRWEGRVPTQPDEDWRAFKTANDIEAVAVDAERWEVVLIRKRMRGKQVAVLPLPDAKLLTGDSIRTNLTPLQELEWTDLSLPTLREDEGQKAGFQYRYRISPTGLDIFAREGGATAVVLTYRHAYWFQRRPSESWATAFQKLPRQVSLPFQFEGQAFPSTSAEDVLLVQREGVAFDSSGANLFVSSEDRAGSGWRLIFLPGASF